MPISVDYICIGYIKYFSTSDYANNVIDISTIKKNYALHCRDEYGRNNLHIVKASKRSL